MLCNMQLVPAVTELIIAELLYLQYKDRVKPTFLYINSTGTTRADGETASPFLHSPENLNNLRLETMSCVYGHTLVLERFHSQFFCVRSTSLEMWTE